MAVSFDKSETKQNLMRAFAGESQARNRYHFAADLAKQQKLYVIEGVFKYTGDQELAHAKRFYDCLREHSGETVTVDGTYPVDLSNSLLDQLRAARHNEYQEFEHDYARFAETARDEGFAEIAGLFGQVAKIEQTHGDRFGLFADLMGADKLFVSDVKVQWLCLNCGNVVETTTAPAACPVCHGEQGYFVRYELSPYAGCVKS